MKINHIVLAIFLAMSHNILAQNDTVEVISQYEKMQFLKVNDLVLKKNDSYCIASFDIDWLVGPIGLQNILGKEVFEVEQATSPNSALKLFIATHDSVFSKKQKSVETGDSLTIFLKKKEYYEGRYVSYYLVKDKIKDGKKEHIEKMFTYDLMHGKLLTLADVFAEEELNRKNLSDFSSVSEILVFDTKIYFAKNSEETPQEAWHRQEESKFTNDFCEMVGPIIIDNFGYGFIERREGKYLIRGTVLNGLEVNYPLQKFNLFKEETNSIIEIMGRLLFDYTQPYLNSFRKGLNTDIDNIGESETAKKKFDTVAEYPGGKLALKEYLQKEMKYPIDAIENGIGGRLTLRIVIDEDGSVKNSFFRRLFNDYKIKIEDNNDLRVRDLLFAFSQLDKESLRVTKKMPKWKPGKNKKGKGVVSYIDIPVIFYLAK